MELIAQSCDGSLRDAETILEQMMVSTNGNLTKQDVQDFVGFTNPSQWIDLVTLMINKDVSGSIKLLNEALNLGIEATNIHKNIMSLLRAVMLYLSLIHI